MATNIEQIFRSFVVTKFREIQEQQFASGKLGNQHNGEINTSGQVNSSDDTIQSIESLQNDPLVQKIEQVLSEVLGTEPRYKSGDGDDIERNNSHSIKRGLSEDVQDEIPRKRSKKDKKHKDKKKKKKRKKEKKEKKYKKHAKETDDQQKECEDMQLSHSDLENSGSLLNAENDIDVHSGSTLNEISPLINEKTVYENLNSAMLNNTFSSDTSKLDTSEEDSTLISIQEVSEVKLANEKELEDDSYHPNVTVNICPEDKSLSDAICTVVERVSDINEVEQAKLMLEITDQENIPESSPYCVRVEPEHLETRLESTAMKVTCVNSVTEPVTSKNVKETVSPSFESTGYKLMTLPLESNAEAKDSVTTLGFLAMVVGKDFEATSEFLNTAKVFTERSPKHSSRKGDSVHELEKTVTMKDLHKPQQFGTERKDVETTAETVHTVLEKDPELDMVVQLKPQQEVSEFDVQKYNRANLGTEILKDMKEIRETCTLMIGLNESEKNAGYLPIQKDATDLQRAPLLENRTRIDSEEHLSIVGLEKTNVEVNSYFTEIDARSDGVTESENWKPAPESSKAKNLECIQEFEKAEQINYLETSLETVVENRGNSKIIQHSLELFSVKVPENASQLKDMNVSETIQTEKIQNLESSKYVDLRNKENKNVEKLKNIPEPLMLVNNLENSSELQCIEEIKIVKETSQSDVEAHKKDFKTVLEPEERDVDAGSGSLQMIFANYSEHNLELYTGTEGMIELKNSDAVLKSLHRSNADNVEPPYAKEIKYVKSTEFEAVTEVNNLQENLKPLQKHVKNVEPASKSIALPTVTYTETLEGTSNRTQSETESHFVQEIEQKCFDSTVKKNQSSVDTTDLGLTSRCKEVIETNCSKIGESELLAKSQDPLFISKSLHEIDVISSEKSNPEFTGIAVVQDLKEPGKSLTAAIDPKDFLKLKNLVLVESKDDFPFGGTMKQFESVSESLEQNQERLENTHTQIRKECLESVPDLSVKCARTEIPFIDEFNIQEKNKKLEEKIETTGLMEAPEPLSLSERDLIVLTSDSGIKVSRYGPETVYLTKTNSEAIPKSYEIQMKDSKTSESKTINVKDVNIDSESLLQAGVEIKEYIPGCKSVVSDSVEFTAEMLPESKSITKLQNSNAVLRSERLTYEHLKTPAASVCVIDTEDLEISPKSTELGVMEKQGVPTSLSASVESTDVSEESFEHNYRADMKKVEASQKSINVEFIGKEKMNDQPVLPSNDNDANVSKLFMSSHCVVRAHIIEERLSVSNEENVSGITSESGTELLKCSEVSETITGQEREKFDITLPEFMVDVQDLKESPNILDAQEKKNLKASQREKYTKSSYVLESRDAADVSQSGSKVEPKGLRATMSYERLSEIKDPVATAMQLKKPELTSSESVSILEVTDTLKTPELKTPRTYLGVTGFKSSDTTAESCPLKIIDSDSQIQHENILEVKNLESASEIKYGLGTFPFKIASESEKVTPDQLSKAISKILSSGNLENLEQILKYRHNQERKDLESAQFDTPVAKDLKGSLTYEEIIGISEMTTQVSKARDTASNLSATVPETIEKCSDIFLEGKTMSGVQATNTNVELDNLIKKSPDISTDINKSKSNSGLTDIMELKCNNASESVQMKEVEDFETVVLDKSVIEIKNLQTVQTSGEKEQMDFQELSKSVLPLNIQNLERNSSLPQQKILETSPEPVKDFVSVSECSSTKDIEQNLKSGFVAEGKAEESTVEHAVLMQDKSAEIIPQFTLEMKDSEATLESVDVANRKDLDVQTFSKEQTTIKPLCMTTEGKAEVNQLETIVLGDSGEAVKPVHLAEKEVIRVGECIEAKDSGIAIESEVIIKDKDLEVSLQDSSKYQDSDVTLNSSEIMKENEGSNLKEKKSEKISSKSKDKSKSGKKTKKSRSKSPSKSKKRKKKSRSRSTSRQVSRRARSRSKHDSSSKRKHSTSRRKSRSKSVDKKEKESSLRSRRRRSRTSDRLKSRSKSPDRRDTSIRSRRRRSRSSDHKSRSRSVERRDSARRRRRLSRSSDNRRSRSRSVDRRETLTRSRRRRSRSSDHHKSRSRSSDKRETSLRTRRRRSQSSDRCRSRSKSFDRRDSSVRTRRRRSRSSDNLKSRSRSPDDKRELSVRRRGRRSRTPETRKSRSRSVDRREISGRGRRRRSRSSDNRKSRSRSVDRRDSSVRIRRRRSRSSDNRRSKSKSVDKRDSSVRMKRRRSVSSDRKSRSRSVDKKETSARSKRRRSQSSDNHKSRSKSVENVETSGKSKRQSKSTDKSRTKSVEKRESALNSSHRRSKSSDRPRSKSKSRSKSSERKKDTDSVDGSRGKHSKYRSKSKSLEKTDGTESLEVTLNNREKSPEQHKSKSRSRSKSVDKAGEKERLRRSRSKGSKSSESRSRRRRTVSRSRRNRSQSQSRSRTRSQSRSRRRRTRSRSISRQRSLSRKRHRRSRRNRSRSTERRRRRSDSRDSFRISLRLRSRSRTPVRLRCSRSTGRRRSASKSPDHRRSRSSSRSPKRLTDLDKAQLLEIAKANAAAMCAKAGVPLPPSLMPVITPEKKEEKVTQKSAKETILELTEKCKKIAQSQEDDVIVNKPHVSDEEEEEHPFINHPFKLNEPKPIFFNLTTPTIKPTPPKNQVTLTKEFPVSSGSQHRKKEADSAYGEWVPVEKDKDEDKDDVFPNPANLEPVDISSALNERTIAQKRLTENTFDLEAMCLLNRAQERIDAWAELNTIPGHFTGSTGAQVLTSEQLSNSGPQAWVKKDQFLRAAPVSGGMGAQLMRKMGWREGEGLGKNKEGNKEPILVDFKTDRKGLVAVGEKTQKRHGPFSTVKDLSGKHPVSALLEVCNKRRWSPPVFVLVNDNRPEYRKHFLFKVMVNGVEHKPSFVSPNKKHAKATAATVALQALGLVPKELLANTTNFRSASHN